MPDNLRELMNRGALDSSTALQILRQVLQTLAFAHWRETDCGPITPDTVLFSRRGKALLAGCGLEITKALQADDEAGSGPPSERPDGLPSLSIDASAVEAAAPFYVAPEQISGGETDQRSDVFAVGILLYEMLTGRHPFGASDGLAPAAVQERILRRPPYEIPPGVLIDLPSHIPAVLARAMAKDPEQRFSDALNFLDALDGPAADLEAVRPGTERVEPVAKGIRPATKAIEPAGVSSRAPKPPKGGDRRWLLYGLAGIIAIALVVAVTLVALDSRADPDTSGVDAAATSTVRTTARPSTELPSTTTTTVPPSTTTTSVAPTTTTTLVRTHYQEDDPLLLYAGTWTRSEDQAASGGSFVFADSAGASVTIDFEGTHLAWIAKRSPVYGTAEVTLDGTRLGTIDLYSAETVFQQKVWGTGQLQTGLHTVTIAWTGEKNPASTGTNINVDEVNVMGALVETENHE